MTPKRLLLLDFFGALATAWVTGCFLATEIVATGLPPTHLWCLSLTAGGFAAFDMVSYHLTVDARRPLAIIAVLNLVYCTTAISACLVYWSSLTNLGLIYFGIEGAIVVPLAILELVMAGPTLKSVS